MRHPNIWHGWFYCSSGWLAIYQSMKIVCPFALDLALRLFFQSLYFSPLFIYICVKQFDERNITKNKKKNSEHINRATSRPTKFEYRRRKENANRDRHKSLTFTYTKTMSLTLSLSPFSSTTYSLLAHGWTRNQNAHKHARSFVSSSYSLIECCWFLRWTLSHISCIYRIYASHVYLYVYV